MENFLINFGDILGHNIWLAFIMALIAGVISSFSPCVLSAIPLVIGYVGGYAGKDKKRAFVYSVTFCIGLALTFTILGAASAVLGRLMTGAGSWWYIVLGFIMLLVGLQLIEVMNFMPDACNLPSKRKGLVGAFILGIVGGVLSSPCATPVLIAILAFVAGQGNIVLGVALLAVYSIGHCVLILIAGTSIGAIQKLTSSPKTEKWGRILKIILGLVVLLVGFYLFYLGF